MQTADIAASIQAEDSSARTPPRLLVTTLRLGRQTCCSQTFREALLDREISTFKQARPGIDHGRGVEFTL
jgi:hypothetical protein